MLIKLLFTRTNPFHLVIAIFGSITGLTMLLLCLQGYMELKELFTKDQGLLKPHYLVITKPISLLRTITRIHPFFSEKEILKLKNLSGVEDAVPFTSSKFRAEASAKNKKLTKGMRTELFFEAIPDNYVDIPSEKWQWEEGSSELVMALPHDYLNLYNFGFAMSQNLPQLSASTIGRVKFGIKISGQGKHKKLRCKIVGFSNRLNTILVPLSFLKWANQKFGPMPDKQEPGRLLVISSSSADPSLYSYLKEHNYQFNTEKTNNSKIAFILKSISMALGIIATIIIVLSFTIFILAFQQMITKSASRIRLLVMLGYDYRKLITMYTGYFAVLTTLITITGFTITNFIQQKAGIILKASEINLSGSLSSHIIIIGIIISLLLFFLNTIFISLQIYNISRFKT
jgi:hypothetical protein